MWIYSLFPFVRLERSNHIDRSERRCEDAASITWSHTVSAVLSLVTI